MKLLLKQYLAAAVIAQLLLACFVDFAGRCFAALYKSMLGTGAAPLPGVTELVLSIRHFAFIWPVGVAAAAFVLGRKPRSDEFWLHFFGVMMLLAIALMIIVLWCLLNPLFTIDFGISRTEPSV